MLSLPRFLITERNVSLTDGDLEFASLCINYLNLPGFRNQPDDTIRHLVREGYYAFMDYAVAH